MQPHVEMAWGAGVIHLMQPSTTAIVYALGVIAIGAGVHFLRVRGPHRARWWWGVALLLWGAGAIAAGTSYEAFSYHLKCAGRDVCAWTSWWEIAYLLLTVASIDAIVMAQAYACAHGRLRRRLVVFAGVHGALYSALVTLGVVTLVPTLISFEMLLAVAVPPAAVCLWLNTRRYHHSRGALDRALLVAWAWLAATIVAYYGYLLAGWTQRLWSCGFWFSENDVLHIGLIVWMLYLARAVAPLVADEPEMAAPRELHAPPRTG